jgi:predicted DNA-binding transcriptional regulator AlpA
MRIIEYRNILKPSVEFLERSGKLMLDSHQMAEFLGVPQRVMVRLASTNRVPGPCRLGLGMCFRWGVLELLEWVEAGCPRRERWIEMRGSSGRYYTRLD